MKKRSDDPLIQMAINLKNVHFEKSDKETNSTKRKGKKKTNAELKEIAT